MQRGCALLGSETAIMCGAMSWVSERHLVSAISNGGGFGVLACGSMTPALLDAEIAATRALTGRPFGVNLITMHPDLDALIAVCIQRRVSHIVLAGGLPPRGALDAIKAAPGVRLLCFAPTLAMARRLVQRGVDGLIIEGHEAGGHIGPVSTQVLAQEILPTMGAAVPIFVAGGIGRGEAIAAFLEMGASGVQLGTRFAAATESIAHPAFKAALFAASARDAVASVQLDPRLPVIPVRALKNAAAADFVEVQRGLAARLDAGEVDQAAAALMVEQFWAGALRRAVVDGDVAGGSLMAGQSVGMLTHSEPVAAIIAALMDQARAALAGRRGD